MTIDDVLTWIAKKEIELFRARHDNIKNDEKWERYTGALDILGILRLHILEKTNPHNREDIKKFNERENG